MVGVVELNPQNNDDFLLFPGLPVFSVDLNSCIRERLKLKDGDQEINRDVAIKVLKSIETRAKIKSFLFKKTTVIILGLLIIGGGVALGVAAGIVPVAFKIALNIASFIFGLSGLFMTSYGLSYCNPELSKAYKDEAVAARDCIQEFKDDDNKGILLLKA